MVGSDDSFPFGTIFRGLLLVVGRVVIQRQSTYKSGTNVTSTFFCQNSHTKNRHNNSAVLSHHRKSGSLSQWPTFKFLGITLLRTNISPPKARWKMFFLFLFGGICSFPTRYIFNKKKTVLCMAESVEFGTPLPRSIDSCRQLRSRCGETIGT